MKRDMFRPRNPTQTPLMLACRRGHDDIVERLLSAGANINATDELTHNTALRMAVTHGHAECANILIREGADVNKVGLPFFTTSSTGSSFFAPHTALIGAIRQFNGTIMPTQPNHIHSQNPEDTRKHRERWLFVIQHLIQLKANINFPGCHTESSPLVESVESTDTRVLKFLLVNGAYVNQQTHVALSKKPLVDTALSLAAYLGNFEAVCILIQNGSNVSSLNVDLTNHLMEKGYWSCLYALVCAGCYLKKATLDAVSQRLAPCLDADQAEFYMFICTLSQQPLPLSTQCRNVLRNQTNISRPNVAKKLGLPKPLEDYITCCGYL